LKKKGGRKSYGLEIDTLHAYTRNNVALSAPSNTASAYTVHHTTPVVVLHSVTVR